MQIQFLATKRLSVKPCRRLFQAPPQRAALEQDLALILTPNVLEHLPEPLRLPRGTSQIAEWIKDREAESDVYSVSDLGSGELRGLLILAQDGACTVHLGYILAEAAWGKGYATELIQGLLEAAPKGKGVTFVAGVGVSNPASSAVLSKCGFALSPEMTTLDTQVYTYAIA